MKGIKNKDDLRESSSNSQLTIPIQSSSSKINNTIKTYSSKLEVVSKGTYSIEEKKVLEKTSLINLKIFVPFLEIDAKEKFFFPIPFSDRDGMLELAPKQKREFHEWIRISDLCEQPSIILGKYPDYQAIKQTVNQSNCVFIVT